MISSSARPAVLSLDQDHEGALRLWVKLPTESMVSAGFSQLFQWLTKQTPGRISVSPTGLTLPLLTAMPYLFDKTELTHNMTAMVGTLLDIPVQVLVSDQEFSACKGALSYVRHAEISPLLQLYAAEVENNARIPSEMLVF